jgi:hypothetical protein
MGPLLLHHRHPLTGPRQQYRLAEKHGLNNPLGLDQRASIIIGWVWLALTALRLLRQYLAPASPTTTASPRTTA